MENKELTEELYKMATEYGACDKVMTPWGGKPLSTEGLIGLWKTNVEFATDKEFPSLEYVRNLKHRYNSVLLKENVFVDEIICADIQSGVVICMGESKGLLSLNEYATGDIHIRHNSKVVVSCKGISKTWITIYDDAEVEVMADDAAKVYVKVVSESCQLKTTGDVVVRYKIKT